MEDVLAVYERPYCAAEPVVCLDEKPVTLHAEVRAPQPAAPGKITKRDNEYKRCGTANEYKASTIRIAIKYADDPAALEQVLESRFVQGEGHGRKALAQLSHAIKRFAEGSAIFDPLSPTQIRPNDIRKIIPVLVHSDSTLRTPGIPHYMSARFKSLGRAKRFTVTPVVLLPITELEELEGYLCKKPLSTFLESFLELLRTDKAAVFLTPLLPVLRGKTRQNGTMLERFDCYLHDMLNRLFPGEAQLGN